MRFLADENFPGDAVRALEAEGYDITWVSLLAPGSSDPEVLAMAVREERILLTFDKDFGNLATSGALPKNWGIVLFRSPFPGSLEYGRRLADLISARTDWAGHFSVVEPGRIRKRPLG